MNARTGWFEVNRAGLAAVAGRRNKLFILRELIQNAWDEPANVVSVEVLDPVTKGGLSTIRVTDNSPEGFHDLTHAYTLFAPSKKVADAGKRGRFNFGEKLVLALCSEARIETTKGTVLFEHGERRRTSRACRQAGSMFEARLRLNMEERAALVACAKGMLVPEGILTTVNGEEVAPRAAVRSFEWYLLTEVATDDGMLKSVYRATKVSIYEVLPGEQAMLYEMGIPVVATGDRWHVDIGQKVPLSMERDNVPPSYLRDVRVAVANHTADLLTADDANKTWARDALADYQCSEATTKRLVNLRFGDKAVIYDPSDKEANSLAVARGYTVVHGSQLNAEEWERVKQFHAMLPAGQVTPSPKPFTPGGRDLIVLPKEQWTEHMHWFQVHALTIANGVGIRLHSVIIADDPEWPFEGCIKPSAGTLHVNAAALGWDWFAQHASPAMTAFLVHEFAHAVEADHLSDRYHQALCDISGKLVRLALDLPGVFK